MLILQKKKKKCIMHSIAPLLAERKIFTCESPHKGCCRIFNPRCPEKQDMHPKFKL